MGSVTNKLLPGSQSLHTKVQLIKGKITSAKLSSKAYRTISRELDETFHSLQKIKTKADSMFAKTHLTHLEEEMRSLYHAYEDGLVDENIGNPTRI